MAATAPRRGLRRDPRSLSAPARSSSRPVNRPASARISRIAAALSDWPRELVFAGDPDLIAARPPRSRATSRFRHGESAPIGVPHRAASCPCLHGRSRYRLRPASPIRTMRATCSRCSTRRWRAVCDGRFGAMVTAPVQKSVDQRRRHRFQRPHRIPRAKCGAARPVMLLVAGDAACRARDNAPALARCAAARHARVARRDARRARASGLRRHSACGARASWSAASTRMPAKAATSGREEQTSSRPALDARARAVSRRPGPVPADTAFTPACSRGTTRYSRCITTRVCRCSSTRVSAMPSTSRSACRSSARRSTTARRSISPAAGARTLAASSRPHRRSRSHELRRVIRAAQTLRPALPARPGRHRTHRRRDRSAAGRAHRRDRPGPRRADRGRCSNAAGVSKRSRSTAT